jgi:hypothetical protein
MKKESEMRLIQLQLDLIFNSLANPINNKIKAND